MPEKATAWGNGGPAGSLFDSRKAMELVNEYHNGEVYREEKYESSESGTKIRSDYEVRKKADGSGYLDIQISTADAEYRETGKILPNIRVQLRRVENEQGGYREPVGWEEY